jgi:hypothetical protein
MTTSEELPAKRPAARWWLTGAIVALTWLVLWFLERLEGYRSAIFAFNLHFVLMCAASLLDVTWRPRLTSRWFEVSGRELALYRRLGVVAFMRLLQRIRWHKAMRDEKVFDGTRRTLASYERATRHGENAHTWLFLVVLAPMTWSAWHGWWGSVAWLGGFNVLFHLYPVMLQRTQRARLMGLIRRRPASSGPGDPGARVAQPAGR